MTNVLQVTITVFRFSFSFLLLKRIDLKIDDMANRLHVYKNKRWGNRERETWHFHVETYTVSQHGLNSKLVWSMSNNMYLFGVHTCLVKTHAKHIHTNSFSKSQCLLHQLTHFVNFLKHVWESKRTIQCTYKDHYHPLIIVIIFIAFVVCCCCLCFCCCSVRLIAQFESKVYDTRCAAQLERSVSVQYNVYAFPTSTNSNTIYWLLQRYNKFLLRCCCSCCGGCSRLRCSVLFTFNLFISLEIWFGYISFPKKSFNALLSSHRQRRLQSAVHLFIYLA